MRDTTRNAVLLLLVGLLLVGGVVGVVLHNGDGKEAATPATTATTGAPGPGPTTATTGGGTAPTTGFGPVTTAPPGLGPVTTAPPAGLGTATRREPLAATGPPPGRAPAALALLGLAALAAALRRRAGAPVPSDA